MSQSRPRARPRAKASVPVATWDPEGYPKLAHLMGRLPEAIVLRKFGPMNMMTLLSLQAKLVALDEDLWRTCYEYQADPSKPEYWTSFKEVGDLRAQKLRTIQATLKEYYELLLLFTRVSELDPPRRDQVRFVQSWLKGEQEGKNFLQGTERFTWNNKYEFDLVVLVKSASWIHPNIIELIHWIKKKIKKATFNIHLWIHKKPLMAPSPQNVDFFDVEIGKLGRVQDFENKGITRLVKLFWKLAVLMIASMLPILAILILYYLEFTIIRIGVALGMTAFVALFLKISTSASVKEIFGATAAFAAVLVVYIGSANGK